MESKARERIQWTKRKTDQCTSSCFTWISPTTWDLLRCKWNSHKSYFKGTTQGQSCLLVKSGIESYSHTCHMRKNHIHLWGLCKFGYLTCCKKTLSSTQIMKAWRIFGAKKSSTRDMRNGQHPQMQQRKGLTRFGRFCRKFIKDFSGFA